MLMTFPTVQALGTSLLASAGLVGIIAGIAAQKTIGNIIAGLQIAATQPIRLDDVVVIDGEWGWVEEIGLTHVFVRIWDLRRLVIPLSYILEHPFQNWTRHSSNVLGTVVIHSDYTVPIGALRQALRSILEQSELWDRQVWNLQVTDATHDGLELRALLSASTGPIVWDLRCHVREKLVEFLREQYPESLPTTRVIVADTPDANELSQRSAA
jgi:small-conductance mechanosensitive channel